MGVDAFAAFERYYPTTSIVTLKASEKHGDRVFERWIIDGVAQQKNRRQISVGLNTQVREVRAKYRRAQPDSGQFDKVDNLDVSPQ
ncbi:MAG: hypothetical protein V3T70_09225 [Phycisphaerae bacterium]